MNLLFLINTHLKTYTTPIRIMLFLSMFLNLANLSAQCPINIVKAGPDQQHCENTFFILDAQTPLSTEWGEWSVLSGEAFITDIYNPKGTAIIMAGKSATLQWKITHKTTYCNGTDNIFLNNETQLCLNVCKNPINTNGNLESAGSITAFDLLLEQTPTAFINATKRPTGWSEGYGTGVNPNGFLGGFYINHPTEGLAHSGKRDIYLRGKDNCIASVQTNNPIICGTSYTVSAYIAPWTIAAAQADAPFKVEFVFQDKEKVLPVQVVEYRLIAPKSGAWDALNWQRYEIKMTFSKSQYEDFTLYFTSDDNTTGIMIDDVCVTSDVSGVIANAGADKVQCGNGTFSLKANTPSIGVGKWSVISGIANISNPNLNVTNVTDVPEGTSATLRWTLNNGDCGTMTDDVVVTNNATPSVSVTSEGSEVCLGTTSMLSSVVAGGVAPFFYQWQNSSDSLTWADMNGEHNTTLTLPTATPSTQYYRLVITSSGNCGKAISSSTKIKVAAFAGCGCIVQSCNNYSKLVFNNVQKTQDNAGIKDDKWRFSNVLPGFDAIVEITNTVNADSLNNIDNTSVNVDDWCPEIFVNFLSGQDSYIDWKVSIVAAGTNTPANLPSSSRVTSYDVDGNNNFREIHGHINSNGYILNAPSELTVLNEPPFAMVLGSINEYASISTDPKVKATFYYPGQNNVFTIRLGVRTNNHSGSFFRQFAVSFDPCVTYAKPDINPQKPEIAGLNETCISNPNSTYTTTQPFTSYDWTVMGGEIVSGQGTRTIKVNWLNKGTGSIKLATVDANGCQGNDAFEVIVAQQPELNFKADLNNAVICSGQSVDLKAVVTGGIGTMNYVWSQSYDNANFETNKSGLANDFNVSGLTKTTYYKVRVDASGNGCGILEAKTSVKVVNPPTADAGEDDMQCSNIFTMQANANADGIGKWTVINGNVIIEDVNSPTTKVTLNSPMATLRWTITVNNTCDASDDVVLSMAGPLSISSNLTDINECVGGDMSLKVAVLGGAGSVTYTWQTSKDNVTWTNVVGASGITYTPSSLVSDTAYYRVKISTTALGCSEVTSATAKVVILPKPKVKVTANNAAVCNGTGVVLSADINGGVGCTIQWQNSSNGGTTWNDISGATTNQLTVTTMNKTTRYRTTLVCTGNGCCN
jgi:large repetitive protein